MRALPAMLGLALATACTEAPDRGDGDRGAPDRAAADALVARLDAAFNERDADAYLANFDPENGHLYRVLKERIRSVLTGPVRLDRESEIQEVKVLNDRLVALVRSTTWAADHSSEITLDEYAYLVSKLRGEAAVGTMMVEVDRGLLDYTANNSIRCPACNYEVTGAAGWLAVPHRKDRTGCMEAVSFYLLGEDLSLDVSVYLDTGPSPAASALSAYLDLAAMDRGVDAPAGVRISPWHPTRYAVDPPASLDGARADLRLAGDEPTRVHLLTMGALRYLLILRGDALDSERAREIVDSFKLLDPSLPPELTEARPVAAHTGGRFDGATYVNPPYRVTLTGPEGWTHSVAASGCLFEITFRSPAGHGKLWATAYGPLPGLSAWHKKLAEFWIEDYCRRSEMRITETGDWQESPDGFKLRDLRTSWPRSSTVALPRMIRLAMADDLLLVLHGYGTEQADRDLIEKSFESLRRSP